MNKNFKHYLFKAFHNFKRIPYFYKFNILSINGATKSHVCRDINELVNIQIRKFKYYDTKYALRIDTSLLLHTVLKELNLSTGYDKTVYYINEKANDNAEEYDIEYNTDAELIERLCELIIKLKVERTCRDIEDIIHIGTTLHKKVEPRVFNEIEANGYEPLKVNQYWSSPHYGYNATYGGLSAKEEKIEERNIQSPNTVDEDAIIDGAMRWVSGEDPYEKGKPTAEAFNTINKEVQQRNAEASTGNIYVDPYKEFVTRDTPSASSHEDHDGDWYRRTTREQRDRLINTYLDVKDRI